MSLLRKGLAAAAGVLAIGVSASANAAALGLGVFVGTWTGNDSGIQGDDGLTPGAPPWISYLGTDCGSSAYGANQIECLIRNAWDGTPNGPDASLPFATLGFPVPDNGSPWTDADQHVNQLDFVGKDIPRGGGTDGLLQVDVDDTDPYTGTWTYLGPSDDSSRPLSDEVIDLYFLIEYGNAFSIFYYSEVRPDDTGDWSLRAWDLCGATFTEGETCIRGNVKGGGTVFLPDDGDFISHFSAYWPALQRSDPVPEPATLGLLGAALAGLGLMGRRRRSG